MPPPRRRAPSKGPERDNHGMRETAAELDELQALIDRGEGSLYARLDADRFFTYSRTPEEFPA